METITRACGHTVTFVPAGDSYDDARREKLRRKRCPPCGRAKNEADNATQTKKSGGKLKKGQEVKALPVLSIFTLGRQLDGSWSGTLSAGEATVEASMGGVMGLVQKLARKWLQQHGAALQGKVQV